MMLRGIRGVAVNLVFVLNRMENVQCAGYPDDILGLKVYVWLIHEPFMFSISCKCMNIYIINVV